MTATFWSRPRWLPFHHIPAAHIFTVVKNHLSDSCHHWIFVTAAHSSYFSSSSYYILLFLHFTCPFFSKRSTAPISVSVSFWPGQSRPSHVSPIFRNQASVYISPPSLSRMECLSEACTSRGLVGTEGTPAWWKLSPCRWCVPCPPFTSNLWKTAKRRPRVSRLGLDTPKCLSFSLHVYVFCGVIPVVSLSHLRVCVGIYVCPCYYFPVRSGAADRPSFVVSVDLKSGAVTPDHWIKRGTALLMSLDHWRPELFHLTSSWRLLSAGHIRVLVLFFVQWWWYMTADFLCCPTPSNLWCPFLYCLI